VQVACIKYLVSVLPVSQRSDSRDESKVR